MNNSIYISLVSPSNYQIRSRSSIKTKWSDEIGSFIKNLPKDEADWVEKYNNGDSYLGVKFKNEEQHLVFVLKWGHLIHKAWAYNWRTHWRDK